MENQHIRPLSSPPTNGFLVWDYNSNMARIHALLAEKDKRSSLIPARLNEYIAGIGIIEVNAQRRQHNQPIFEYATILTGIHMSPTDLYPHATLAAATREMREQGHHMVVHTRVDTMDLKAAKYKGSFASSNTRVDFDELLQSYAKPIRARASLFPDESNVTPVGCIFMDEKMQWYLLDPVQKDMVFLEPDAFYRAGEGNKQHLSFWNPLQKKICRASFLGNERPEPRSPNPEPSNLEAGMEDLSLEPIRYKETIQYEEWVELKIRLDTPQVPVLFNTKSGLEVLTSWESWLGVAKNSEWVFRYDDRMGNRYWTSSLPGEWIEPRWDKSSQKPIQFVNKNKKEIRTKRNQWITAMDESFYIYLKNGVFYISWKLPLEDE